MNASVPPFKPTRGERNNNPFNLRRNDQQTWRGERVHEDDPAFEQFDTAAEGMRAGFKVLLAYYRAHGLHTVDQIINRFAPSSENNTLAYVTAVARDMGVEATALVNLEDATILQRMGEAIIRHENGRVIYDRRDIRAALDEAYRG